MKFLKDELTGFVPEEQAGEIIKNVVRGSSLMKLAKVENMKSDRKKFSVMTEGAGAYWVGEGQRIQTSKASWIHPEIVVKKLAVIIPVSKEKINDSTIDVFSELKETIGEAFFKKIDAAGFFGTDSPFETNILKSATNAANLVTAGTNASFDLDVSDAMAMVEENGYDVNAFAARNGIKNTLRKLRDANGNQLYVEGVNSKELYNVPIEFSRNGSWDATKSEIICGNFDMAIVGIREGIEYQVLKEATLEGTLDEDGKPISLAEQDLIAIKATMRLGFLVVKDEAFAVVIPKVAKAKK